LVEVEKNRSIEIEVEAAKVKTFVVVGIPAFNEDRTIAKVVLESQRFADKVVVCDDGSSDMTAEIAEQLDADVVRHERNLGYGARAGWVNGWFDGLPPLQLDIGGFTLIVLGITNILLIFHVKHNSYKKEKRESTKWRE